MIEYALTCLQAEWWSFSNFYQTDCASVEYEMFDDHGVAYLVDGDSKVELATIYFEDVAKVMNNALIYTEKPFMALIPKYGLQPPRRDDSMAMEIQPIESEEKQCQETN
jgi:hypothetical protein